jgi:hypothetical protein
MYTLNRQIPRLLALVALLSSASLLHAQGGGDGPQSSVQVLGGNDDMAQIMAYRLSDASLSRYTQAVRDLLALPEAELRAVQASAGDAVTTLDGAVAVYEGHPRVAGVITRTGLSVKDFLLFSIALTQAAAAAGSPGADDAARPAVHRENAAFYRAHEAELRRLSEELAERVGP